MLDALALQDEQVRCLAQVLALRRRHILLLHRPDLLDHQRVVALHAVVVDVQQILLVDEHTAQVHRQHQPQVAAVAVHLHILDIAYLVALTVHRAEAAANLVALQQQRVVGLIDVVGLEEIHILIAAQLAETAEGHIRLVTRQAGDVLVRAHHHDVVRPTTVILHSAGGVIRVVGTVVRTLHLHHQQTFLLHLALEHRIRHALRFRKHLLRVHAHHLLRRVDHVRHENRQLVGSRLVEQLLEDRRKVRRRGIADTLRSLEDIRVADELRETLRIGVDLRVHHVDVVVVATARQLVQHTHDGSLERAVATGGIIRHHRPRALQVEVHAQRAATRLDVDLLRRTAALEEVTDVLLHRVDVQLPVLIEVLEVRLLAVEELRDLFPLRSINHLVLVGNVE